MLALESNDVIALVITKFGLTKFATAEGCRGREPVHFLAQIARIPTLGDGQEAEDCVPSTFCVTLGSGEGRG
jgi:hypothetical protein